LIGIRPIPRRTAHGQERRAALRRLGSWLLAGAVSGMSVSYGKGGRELVCADPHALSDAENRQRRLDNYTEKSPDPRETCSGCGFFTAGVKAAACGKCQLFNGPVNPRGKCDDWTARPA
jgi:hypothetical protein